MRSVLLVALGGSLGSIFRYLLGKNSWFNTSHWAIFTINIIGSFAIGILFAYSLKHPENKWIHPLLITGLCGGFTTFSTFSLDVVKLFHNGAYTSGITYILLSVLVSILLTSIGFLLFK